MPGGERDVKLKGVFRVEHYDKDGNLKNVYYAHTDSVKEIEKDGNDKRRAESRA